MGITIHKKLIAGEKTEEIPAKDINGAIWDRIVAKLRFVYGDAAFNSWLKPLRLKSTNGRQVTLTVPTRFMREWITSHYSDDIRKFFQEENPRIISVDIEVDTTRQPEYKEITEQHGQAIISGDKVTLVNNEGGYGIEAGLDDLPAKLDPRFIFDNFVVGSTNQLAHAAARGVAESSSVVAGSNPLFLYGGVGLGKTHLMQAIAWHIHTNNPQRKVIYMSAEKFMYQFIRALRNKDTVAFKEYFRSVDVLMIDDIQFICGKNSTQEEFFHTFNALIDNNCQLILSGDRSPSDLDGMEERIRSRLGWGLVADINATTYELRLGILESKLEKMEVDIPQAVIEFLASKISSNIRELEGALNKVIAHANLMKQDITLENTQYILRDLLRSNEHVVTVDDIKKTVAEYCNIKISDMHSARRARAIARPRQIAMYLSKKFTPYSLPEIGRKFGGKDHTTVMHAVKRVEKLCSEDSEFHDDVEILTRKLQG